MTYPLLQQLHCILAARTLVADADTTVAESETRDDGSVLWRDVPAHLVLSFLGRYESHPDSPDLARSLIVDYITKQLKGDSPTLERWSYHGERNWHEPMSLEHLQIARENPYARQLRHLCAVVRGEEQPLIDANDGMRTLRATIAVHESARTGAPVHLED